MSPKHETMVGRTLEKCKLVAKLGTGGMGSVYLAEHAGLGRKVAVKILPADLCRDPEYVARFRREALTAGRMEHPNIVQVYDVGQAEGRHFLVMQYIDGESLSTIVENLGAMDPNDAARVTAGVLRGLHHAHEQGVVHRDVKPDNILVSKGDRPMLLDFGLAIEQETSLQITKDGMVVGTPYYLSPEQAQGRKASPKSDIYAAGVSLYYLLTGRRPFTGATALAVLNKHIHESPLPPIQINAKVPRVLNDIVLKLMAKNPADRYATAAAAAQALENFLEGKAVDVGLPLKARFAALPPPFRYGLLGGAAALAVLLLGGLLIAVSSGSAPPPPPPSVDQPPPFPPAPAPAADPVLVDLRAEAKRVLQENDYAAMQRALDRYDSLVALAPTPDVGQLAQRSRDEFFAEVKRRAEQEYARLRGGKEDLLARIRALDGYPRPLLAIDDLRELRTRIREERDSLLELLDVQFQEDEAKLVKLLQAADTAAARALGQAMEDYGQELRYGKESRLLRLRKIREEEIPRLERDAADRLVQAYIPVRAALERALLERKRPEAYAAAVRFLKETTDRRIRADGVSYDALLGIVPDTQLSEARLSNATLLLSTVWSRAKDELAFRILSDLQDVLDLEWLFRQVFNGVRRLSAGNGPEVRLETYGMTGRVGIGPGGLQLTPKAGAARIIEIAKLRPADLVLFAAAAEGLPVEEALDANAQLARAAGVAWLYSPVTDRWLKADALLSRAEGRGMAGPTFRRAQLRGIARAKALELMAQARAGAAVRFEDSRKVLAELDAAWGDDADMRLEIGRASAVVVGGELRRSGKNYGRIKLLARDLYTAHPELLEDPAILSSFAHAVRQTGDWLTVAADLKPGTWTASVPAVEEKSSATGIRLKVGGTLDLAPAVARSFAGFNAQMRVNETGRPFAVGFLLDRGARKILLRESGEVSLLEAHEGRDRALGAVVLDARPGPNRWFDLAWAQEGDVVVVYFDARPLFARRVVAPPASALALTADVAANFRGLTRRQ